MTPAQALQPTPAPSALPPIPARTLRYGAAPPDPSRTASALEPFLAALLLLCVARLWLMPLASSFWVDEMATSFVVRHGASDPSLRVAPQVAASVYYALPRAVERLWGFSEIAYRLPSALAMALALFLIARLAGHLIHRDSGWFAAFACLALRGFNYQAADARPYALGTLVLAFSLWFLVRWFDSGRWLHALAFAAGAAMLWRVHLIFWPLYGLFVLYAAIRLRHGETVVTWRQCAAVFAGIGLSLLPLMGGAWTLYRQAGAHVVAPAPSPAVLVAALKLGLVAGVSTGACLLGLWIGWPRGMHRFPPGALGLVAGWWLCQPVALFTFSWLSGNSVFVPRYLAVALPGAALAATAVAAALLPARYWKVASLALGFGVLLLLGQWNRLWPVHHDSDWRGAALRFNELALGPDVPVICPSPFIEARVPAWRPDSPARGFLYSHLLVYRIQGREYPFPFEVSSAARVAAASLLDSTLAGAGRFAIYGEDHAVLLWRDWFASRPELARWQNRRLGPFGDVEVVVFERQGVTRNPLRRGRPVYAAVTSPWVAPAPEPPGGNRRTAAGTTGIPTRALPSVPAGG